MPSCYALCIVAIAWLGLFSVPSKAVRIAITPDYVNGTHPAAVNITCNPDGLTGPILSLVVMEIGKVNESPLVIMHQNNAFKEGDGYRPSFVTSGHMSHVTPSESELTLTLTAPLQEDAGEYECIIFYMDLGGKMKKNRNSANLTVDIPDPYEMLKELKAELGYLKSMVRDHDSMLYSHRSAITHLIENATAQQEKKIEKLENLTNDQRDIISDLQQRLRRAEQIILEHNETLADQDKSLACLSRSLDVTNTTTCTSNLATRIDEKFNQYTKNITDLKYATEMLEDTTLNHTRQLAGKSAAIAYMDKSLTGTKSMTSELARRQAHLQIKVTETAEVVNRFGPQMRNLHDRGVSTLKMLMGLRQEVANETQEWSNAIKKTCECTNKISPQGGSVVAPGRGPYGGIVAFFAGYDGAPFARGGPISFTEVFFNEGHHYNTKSGMFEAPVDGFYVFHLAIMTGKEGFITVSLTVNRKVVAKVFERDYKKLDQSTISTMLQLKKGDFVQASEYTSSTGMIIANHPSSFFSGYLFQSI